MFKYNTYKIDFFKRLHKIITVFKKKRHIIQLHAM